MAQHGFKAPKRPKGTVRKPPEPENRGSNPRGPAKSKREIGSQVKVCVRVVSSQFKFSVSALGRINEPSPAEHYS